MAKEKSFKEFMNMKEEEQILFDFSNQRNNVIDNFFVYMAAVSTFSAVEESKLFKVGNFFKMENSIDRIIIHPDKNSKLLQDIYKKLWDNNSLNACWTDKKIISGETMNSATTTLNALYERYVESTQEKEKRKEISLRQQVSSKYIMSLYAMEYYDFVSQPNNFSGLCKRLGDIKGLDDFLYSFHTLGNFIPFPRGCNCPRGTGILKDYWDLTLACIYNWYNPEDAIENISLRQKYSISMITPYRTEQFESWLKCFGDWDGFVETNFLGDWNDEGHLRVNFVTRTQKTQKRKYGCPRELWKGHFNYNKNVIPIPKKDYESFFTNAAERIQNRGKLMVRKLVSCENN